MRLLASADVIRKRAPASVEIEPDGEHACVVTVGSDNAAMVAKYLAWWDAPFEVLDSPRTPLLAASVFLDVLNVFTLFLPMFGNDER